jgi:two-component system, OmpR family, sensor histidine kinase ChvG
VLVGIFLALPFVLYGQLANGDAKLRALVTSGIQQRNWLIAEALKPTLDQAGAAPSAAVKNQLARYALDGTALKLMFRPASRIKDGFYYVASAPPVNSAQLAHELSDFQSKGVLPQLVHLCSKLPGDPGAHVERNNIDAAQGMLTSIIPLKTSAGCWALVISHSTGEFLDTSISRPYWQSPEVTFAAAIYVALASLSVLAALSVWKSIRVFGGVAREIRQGRVGIGTFSSRNVVPEFARVAEDFDELAMALHGAARDIREAAEENAHSFKGPIATIGAALAGLTRTLPEADERQRRMLDLIGISLRRLTALVFASQRLETLTADLIDAPRTRINLTQLVAELLLRYTELCAARDIKLARYLGEDLYILASPSPLTEAIENVLDNAISFSPRGALIEVRLNRKNGEAELVVLDQGPGIDPDKIEHVFDRYFSLRGFDNNEQSGGVHAGLGLWIVRRNIEAIGGHVTATNRLGGGLMIRALLPIGS